MSGRKTRKLQRTSIWVLLGCRSSSANRLMPLLRHQTMQDRSQHLAVKDLPNELIWGALFLRATLQTKDKIHLAEIQIRIRSRLQLSETRSWIGQHLSCSKPAVLKKVQITTTPPLIKSLKEICESAVKAISCQRCSQSPSKMKEALTRSETKRSAYLPSTAQMLAHLNTRASWRTLSLLISWCTARKLTVQSDQVRNYETVFRT